MRLDMKTAPHVYPTHHHRELPEWVAPAAWSSALLLGTAGVGIHLKMVTADRVHEYSTSIETRAATPPRYLAATTADQLLVDVVGAAVHRLKVLEELLDPHSPGPGRIEPATMLKLVEQIGRDQIKIQEQSTFTRTEFLNAFETLISGALTDLNSVTIAESERMDLTTAASALSKTRGAIAMGKLILKEKTVNPR